MPIYAYSCGACGHAKDVLQKMSDPSLTICPACGAQEFKKQVTAAGFQLKGSGWYVTDFRGGSKAGPAKSTDSENPSSPSAEPKAAESSASPADAVPATAAPAPSATPTAPTSPNAPKPV